MFKVFSLVDYKTYIVGHESRLLPSDITVLNLFNITDKTVKTNEATTGSAILIYYENNRIALLTCAHIFHHPDTIYSWYEDNDPLAPNYLEGVSIKQKQHNFFRGYPEGSDLEILAIDYDLDLAIIGKEIEGEISLLKVFPYPLGKSEELDWGNFAYIMGYPMGYQMITRGIVSKPESFLEDSFLIDAIFNEGFSGSAVLAVRDGVPNFELVGIGKSASVSYENILVPAKKNHEMIYNPNVPYTDEVYVDLKKDLNYGITYAISTRSIRRFFEENRKALEEKGYFLQKFFLGEE